MEFPQDQIDELLSIYPGAKQMEEGGTPYFLLPNVVLPGGANPAIADLLLRPVHLDGYDSRLFYSQQPTFSSRRNTETLNWNAVGVHILSRNWNAFSWRTRPGLTLTQMVALHMGAIR
ncbi:hypothetical protein KA183_19080 [bacterium]|nr:hypothetical protein [bacterium]